MLVKYPSTLHLPFSPGVQSDDKRVQDLDGFLGREVVITEKLDGENTTMYTSYIHARSLDSRHHPSRDWVKQLHGEIGYKIPVGWRVCGENVYARHSIAYDDLTTYFYGFSIWDETNTTLSWDETLLWFDGLGIEPVPELYRGVFDVKALQGLVDSLDTRKVEGFVVRVVDRIPFRDFGTKVAKWVREGHVQTEKHWMSR